MNKLLKIFLATLVLTFTFSHAFAWETELNQALAKSKATGKMLFVIFGREACGNCQHLKKMINDGSVKLAVNRYVIADINCDDKNQSKIFKTKFPSVSGKMLPFVAIAGPDGNLLASRTGFGKAAEYQKLITEAEKKK